MWAEVLIGILGCAVVLGLAAFANENVCPKGVATRIAEEHGIDRTAGRAAASRWASRGRSSCSSASASS